MSEADVAGASRPTRRLTVLSAVLWAILALAVPLAALTLNALQVAGFPLGFWFAAQGSLMGLAALAILFTWKAGGDHGREGVIGPLTFAGECIASAGFIGFAGLIAQIGFDALSYPLGLAAGLALMAILIAPRYVLYPGRTFAGFCSARFDGPWPRRLALLVIGVASVFLLAADIRGLGLAIQALAGLELSQALAAAATLLSLVWLALSLLGERRPRGLVYGALLVAFSTPLVMMAVFQHRLPLPYWSYGFALQDVATLEQGLIGQKLADFRALKPLTSPFLQLSNWNFAGIVLAVAFGIAALPQFLGRHLSPAVVNPGEAVRRTTITTALVALFLCGLAPFATFTRAAIAGLLQTGVKVNALPETIPASSGLGWLDVCGARSASTADLAAACAKVQGHKGVLRLQDLVFGSDSYLFAAAKVSGIEGPLWLLLALGALTAALVGGHAILAGYVAAEAEARRDPSAELYSTRHRCARRRHRRAPASRRRGVRGLRNGRSALARRRRPGTHRRRHFSLPDVRPLLAQVQYPRRRRHAARRVLLCWHIHPGRQALPRRAARPLRRALERAALGDAPVPRFASRGGVRAGRWPARRGANAIASPSLCDRQLVGLEARRVCADRGARSARRRRSGNAFDHRTWTKGRQRGRTLVFANTIEPFRDSNRSCGRLPRIAGTSLINIWFKHQNYQASATYTVIAKSWRRAIEY